MERPQITKLGDAGRLVIGSFVLDLQRGELLDASGRQAELRKQALDVLLVLAANIGHVVTKDELLGRVWAGSVVTEDSLVQAVADIRRLFGDRGHALVRTVPRRGYLLALPQHEEAPAAPALAKPDEPAQTPPPSAQPAPAPSAGVPESSSARRWLLVVLGSIAVAAVVWWLAGLPGVSRDRAAPRIAVLGFHERGAGVVPASLGTGISEDLVMELGRNQDLNVVSHYSSFALSGKGLSTLELGRQLRAEYLIDGVLQRQGETLDLEVQMIDVRADKVLWVSRQRTEGGQVVHARDAVVAKVAGSLFSTLRESEKQRAVRAPPKSLDVYALTQRGLGLKHQFTQQATREGRAALQQALAEDAQYGPAWWVLGWLNAVDAHQGLSGEWAFERMPEAVAQINRGIALDPHSSGAYTALSVALIPIDRAASLAAAARAVELGPSDADAWIFLSLAMAALRPAPDALAAAEKAIALNPFPPAYFQATYAYVLWMNGRHEEALQRAQACSREAPRYPMCAFVQLLAHTQHGDLEAAGQQRSVLGTNGGTASGWCGGFAGAPEVTAACLRLAISAGMAR